MTARNKLSHKLISLLLCVAITVSCLPLSLLTASADTQGMINQIADTSTMNDWQEFFPIGDTINTENAGGVWTDKSVFTASPFSDITMQDNGDFLVALSAIASNMTVTGMSGIPADTILVLDVSGSMSGSATQLVTAANATLKALLEANPYNRVGVVLYSGPGTVGGTNGTNDAVLTLPLGRYTTSSTYLNINNSRISLNSSVTYEGTTTRPSSTGKSVNGGTYVQRGVKLAMDQFTADSNETTVSSGSAGAVTRQPIMVLMSDGAPTLATTNFTNPTSSNMGDGTSSNAAIGFSTQLTIAYAKQQIEAKYDTDALLYTLGVGLTTQTEGYQVARCVLNPTNTYTNAAATAMRNFWTTYQRAAVGSTITIQSQQGGGPGQNNQTRSVTKISQTLESGYVDQYFAANSADDLVEVFQEIVSDISLRSKYFPTLIDTDEELSGYISFVDRIGQYMEVKSIEGIRLHQTLFSGAELASNFVEGGGLLGTYDNPTQLGDEMVWAVMARLGLSDADTARTLLGLAYNNGQLAYNATTGEFSNYIGWVADANGKYLGFWHEGIEESNIPSGAVYIMKSYGYLGETDEAHGVEESDMMYATVQVRESIQTGEQTVSFAVPAALIPTVTYEVTLDENGALENLETSGATAPVRLVYTVGLREEINPFTLTDIVDSDYIAANSNADGTVNFYTNQYETDNSTGYNKVNTYSYFRPSRQNDRYYYQVSSLLYTDDRGTVYTGTTQPSGEMYHAYTVYEKDGNSLTARTAYHRLTAETLATTEKNADNTWYIPVGDVRRDYAGFVCEKEYEDGTPGNPTGTLSFSAAPYTDIENHNVNDTDHSFVVGATLGNNGKLTLAAETGIKLTKTLAAGTAATDADFEFTVTGAAAGAHPAYRIDADGTASETTVVFDSDKQAVITLKAGQTLYIGGMAAGDSIIVTETETDQHMVQTVTVNGIAGDSTNIQLTANTFTEIDYINAQRGTGNLIIAKEITNPFGDSYAIPETVNSFDMTLTLTLNGKALANKQYTAVQSNDPALTAVTTDADGKITVEGLAHDSQIEIFGLPEGALATVVEDTALPGFAATYWNDGTVTADPFGQVTVSSAEVKDILVVNQYTPDEVSSNIISLQVNKTLTGRDWLAEDTFTFALQKWNGTAWVNVGSQKEISGTATQKTVDFTAEIKAETYAAIGSYYYRVVEIEPEPHGILGISYDKALHGFIVTVTDLDMDGELEINTVERASTTLAANVTVTGDAANGFLVTADFTNTFAANAADASIEIHKLVTNPSNSSLAVLSGFRFEIYKSDAQGTVGEKLDNALQPALTTSTGTTRTTLHFTDDDLNNGTTNTLYYAIKEVDGQKTGWTYSSKTEYVTVVLTVENNDGEATLVAAAYAGLGTTGTGTTTAAVSFENTYQPVPTTLALDFVRKDLSGRALNDGEFSFKLVPAPLGDATSDLWILNGTTPTAAAEITGKNSADGTVAFTNELYFDQVGTYFYEIVETAGNLSGVTYDNTTYRVYVTVSDIGGALQADYQVINVPGKQITFANSYAPTPVKYAITASKELEGRALVNGEFTFLLTQADDANGTVTDGQTYQAHNAVDGKITFSELTYTEAGDYYYVVTEQPAADTNATYGIRYDTAKFVVTVRIRDDQQGSLTVDSVSPVPSEIKFVNTYEAKPTEVSFNADKILTGRVLNDAEFSFSLYHADADWMEGALIQTVNNNENGDFAFTAIRFDRVGTYTFLVKEDAGNAGGITYDSTEFRIQVDVTDDLRGQLHATVQIFDNNGIAQSDILFMNFYEVTGSDSIVLNGSKTLTGRDLQDDEFTFALYETDEAFTLDAEQEPVQTAKNQAGKFSFRLDYTAADVGNVYYYLVNEQNAGMTIDHVTYSSASYCITVTVEDDGVGGIETTAVITDGTVSVETMKFVNTYKQTEVTPPPPGSQSTESSTTPTEAPEKTPTNPTTGDSSMLQLWIALLFISTVGLATTAIYGRKRKEQTR